MKELEALVRRYKSLIAEYESANYSLDYHNKELSSCHNALVEDKNTVVRELLEAREEIKGLRELLEQRG